MPLPPLGRLPVRSIAAVQRWSPTRSQLFANRLICPEVYRRFNVPTGAPKCKKNLPTYLPILQTQGDAVRYGPQSSSIEEE